jgi:hypothetical protein
MAFERFMLQLAELGVLDVLLPFLLIFTIVFAVLQKTKILGDGRKNFNVIVALVMALSVVIPHVTGSYYATFGFDPVTVINDALPQVSIIVIAIVMMLIIIGVFGNDFDIAGTSLSGLVVILAFVAVVLIFGSGVGWFYMPDWLYWLNDPEIQSLVIMILVFGIIIWFITKEDKPSDPNKGFGKFLEGLGKSVKEKK